MDPEQQSGRVDHALDVPDPDTVYMGSSEEVAQRLGVTTAGLRRLADIYDTVYEPLQRDDRHNKRRLWTLAAINRLEAARRLVQDDRARSIKVALEMGRDGVETPSQDRLALPQDGSQHAVLIALLEHVQRLEARMEAMQRQLEAPKGKTDGDTELAEQRRLNQYLMGELERRSKLETAPRRRPWWRWWSS